MVRDRRHAELVCDLSVLLVLSRNGAGLSTHAGLVATVAVTTVCWIITAYVAPPTDRDVLIRFYKLVRPAGPGWANIRAEAGLPASGRVSPDNIPLALVGWVAGCTAIWTALFTVGSILYGRWTQTMLLGVVFLISAVVLIGIVRNLWQGTDSGSAA